MSLYALAVEDIDAAAGFPKIGTAELHGFVLNKGLGDKVLGKASLTATYGQYAAAWDGEDEASLIAHAA